MSTNEFERENHRMEGDDLFPSAIELALPEDFSEEDVAFAQELSTLFSPEEEILPPYFAQTLLEVEDARYTAVDTAFAQKTSVRVFRSLRLRRSIFSKRISKMSTVGEALREITMRKSLLAWAAALTLFMMFTVAFTAPSFEQGVSMLLHGSRSGVLQVKHFNGKVRHNHKYFYSFNTHPEQVNLLQARQLLDFNIYWPQSMPANYLLSAINIYEDSTNTWASGPIVDLVYDLNSAGSPPKGTGQIVVREFMPLEQVLQVVQDGNAYAIDPDQYGNPSAIYVDGQWLPTDKMQQHKWSNVGRSEVIYQQDGVVFWIAGDQRDGVTQKVLWDIAQSLHVISFMRPAMLKDEVTILQVDNPVNGPFSNDILSVSSDSSPGGQYYVTLSSYISGKPAASKTVSHGR
ncbi:MAG TPA: hypothetical protein VKR83_00335 [Ktedonobacteraceae bacterium]|nr:hypothetical protein [Ktedonobacteraceae bacterium]